MIHFATNTLRTSKRRARHMNKNKKKSVYSANCSAWYKKNHNGAKKQAANVVRKQTFLKTCNALLWFGSGKTPDQRISFFNIEMSAFSVRFRNELYLIFTQTQEFSVYFTIILSTNVKKYRILSFSYGQAIFHIDLGRNFKLKSNIKGRCLLYPKSMLNFLLTTVVDMVCCIFSLKKRHCMRRLHTFNIK